MGLADMVLSPDPALLVEPSAPTDHHETSKGQGAEPEPEADVIVGQGPATTWPPYPVIEDLLAPFFSDDSADDPDEDPPEQLSDHDEKQASAQRPALSPSVLAAVRNAARRASNSQLLAAVQKQPGRRDAHSSRQAASRQAASRQAAASPPAPAWCNSAAEPMPRFHKTDERWPAAAAGAPAASRPRSATDAAARPSTAAKSGVDADAAASRVDATVARAKQARPLPPAPGTAAGKVAAARAAAERLITVRRAAAAAAAIKAAEIKKLAAAASKATLKTTAAAEKLPSREAREATAADEAVGVEETDAPHAEEKEKEKDTKKKKEDPMAAGTDEAERAGSPAATDSIAAGRLSEGKKAASRTSRRVAVRVDVPASPSVRWRTSSGKTRQRAEAAADAAAAEEAVAAA
jgi:hypothetical protein